MHVVLIGCEYTGKTTLAEGISAWLEENMGPSQWGSYGWHDHFVRPFVEGPEEDVEGEAQEVLAMSSKLLEKYSRYMIEYHAGDFFFLDDHLLLVNWYYADAVYAPLYYGYGGRDEYADRQWMARQYDAKVMKKAPDTVLVLVKASPEVVRERMQQDPHRWSELKDDDVELVLKRFEEEYTRSGIRRRFTLDTTETTPDETLKQFITKMEPHFTQADKLALVTRRSKSAA
jgi:thymidylate kinase